MWVEITSQLEGQITSETIRVMFGRYLLNITQICSMRLLYQLYLYRSENWRCQKAAMEWHDLHLIFSAVNRYYAYLCIIDTMIYNFVQRAFYAFVMVFN